MLEDVEEERVTLQLIVSPQTEEETPEEETCDFCRQPAKFLFSVGYEHWQVCAKCRDEHPDCEDWLWH